MASFFCDRRNSGLKGRYSTEPALVVDEEEGAAVDGAVEDSIDCATHTEIDVVRGTCVGKHRVEQGGLYEWESGSHSFIRAADIFIR